MSITIWTLACIVVSCMHYNVDPYVVGITLEDKLGANAIRSLEHLCPRVDICNPTATGPFVERNKILDDGEFVSICYGCSCHKDCRDMLNCCFPEDSDSVPVHTTGSPFTTNKLVPSWTGIPSVTENSVTLGGTTPEDNVSAPAKESGLKPEDGVNATEVEGGALSQIDDIENTLDDDMRESANENDMKPEDGVNATEVEGGALSQIDDIENTLDNNMRASVNETDMKPEDGVDAIEVETTLDTDESKLANEAGASPVNEGNALEVERDLLPTLRALSPIIGIDGALDGDESTSAYEAVSRMQCLYARVGIPDETWIDEVPAYRMVTRAPSGGCNPDTFIQLDGTHPCRELVAPWGDFLPVYSTEHNTIYKNHPCARCHGATDSTRWTATLVCDVFDNNMRAIPVSDHFAFFQENSSSPHCFISLDFKDLAILRDNRCFLDTVTTCAPSLGADSFQIPDGVDLTHEEIVEACLSGLNSPIYLSRVYRNVFCAICNSDVGFLSELLEVYSLRQAKRFGIKKTTYLLDTSFIEVDKTKLTPARPKVCLRDKTKWVEESCRELYCPFGQVRNNKGVCQFPSRRWGPESLSFTTKLRYINPKSSIQKMLSTGQISVDSLLDGFQKSRPWSTDWRIDKILRTSDDAAIDPMVVIELITRRTGPDVGLVLRDIRQAMAQRWIVSVNETRVHFQQSILEYSFIRDHNTGMLVPSWQSVANELGKGHSFFNFSSVTWSYIYIDHSVYEFPYDVRKSFSCEQVALSDDEYTLMLDNLVLMNNLTGTTMFEKEFEISENGNGRLIPRVCVSDTPFVLRTDASASNTPATCSVDFTSLLICSMLYIAF